MTFYYPKIDAYCCYMKMPKEIVPPPSRREIKLEAGIQMSIDSHMHLSSLSPFIRTSPNFDQLHLSPFPSPLPRSPPTPSIPLFFALSHSFVLSHPRLLKVSDGSLRVVS